MKKTKHSKSRFRKWLKSLFWAFIFLLLVRTFCFQFYTVTYNKMENTFLPGDYLIVNKLSFGPRLPITFLALPFNDNFMPFFGTKSYINLFELPYFRFKLDKIDRNDVLIFNYPNLQDIPTDIKPLDLSRCIGLPGDTLLIKDKVVFINSKEIIDSFPAVFHYRITTNGTFFTQSFLDSMHVTGKLIAEMGVYEFYMTKQQANQFKTIPFVRYIQKVSEFWSVNSTLCFPENSKFISWNKDYFGPVVIPEKGQTIDLSIKNIDIYKKIISNYEKNDLTVNESNNLILINGKPSNTYTFKQDYYFMMDDNRDMAKDSRYWGFLPESHIIGKTSTVWLSIEKGRDHSHIRWHRLFKSFH